MGFADNKNNIFLNLTELFSVQNKRYKQVYKTNLQVKLVDNLFT